jgi:Secretion system C-terminal sorting domain
MKNIIVINLLLLVTVFSNGQSIFDNFENANCDGNECTNCAVNFINHSANTIGCLPNWFASHGTPNTFGPQYNPVSTALVDLKTKLTGQCLNIWWSSSQQNEGAFRTFSFRPQVCYKISFKVSAASQNDIPATARYLLKVFAAKNIPPKGCCVPEEPLPVISDANKQFVGDIEFPRANLSKTTFTNWQTVTFFFRTTTTDFNQIWLFPEVSGGTLILAIDDFSINEQCSSGFLLNQTTPVYSGNFASSNIIKVGSGTNISTSFSTAMNTTLKATEQILFSNNTRILTPSNNVSFIAKIEPCVLTNAVCGAPANSITHIESFGKESNTYKEEAISVLPNPTSGVFQISTGMSDFTTEKVFEIYNMLGALLYQGKFKGNDYYIDISDKPSGNYLIKVKINDHVQTLKFVKN